MKLPKINWFELVYLAIALATFQHTTWAAATVFEGPRPMDDITALRLWYFNGSLLAIAIDIGMLVAARELRKAFNLVMLLAFVIAAVASFYTQILFSIAHTAEFTLGPGVSTYWKAALDGIIQARVLLVPAMLPLFAIIFTITPIVSEKQIAQQRAVANEKPFPFHGARKTWHFATEDERDQFAEKYSRKQSKHVGNGHQQAESNGYSVVAITNRTANGENKVKIK